MSVKTEQIRGSKKELSRIARFGLVGILNTVVDFAVFNILFIFLSTNQSELASIVSGTAAMINSFILNKNFTFRVKDISLNKKIMFFVVTAFGLYVIRPIIISIFTKTWLWPSQVLYEITSGLGLPFSQDFDTRNLALVAAIAIVLIYNYLCYKYFIFNEKDKK